MDGHDTHKAKQSIYCKFSFQFPSDVLCFMFTVTTRVSQHCLATFRTTNGLSPPALFVAVPHKSCRFSPCSYPICAYCRTSPIQLTVVRHRLNLLKPNDIYICRTAALTSRRYILNIYSTNIHTEYFKHSA